jgi:hypothetical protein
MLPQNQVRSVRYHNRGHVLTTRQQAIPRAILRAIDTFASDRQSRLLVDRLITRTWTPGTVSAGCGFDSHSAHHLKSRLSSDSLTMTDPI